MKRFPSLSSSKLVLFLIINIKIQILSSPPLKSNKIFVKNQLKMRNSSAVSQVKRVEGGTILTEHQQLRQKQDGRLTYVEDIQLEAGVSVAGRDDDGGFCIGGFIGSRESRRCRVDYSFTEWRRVRGHFWG